MNTLILLGLSSVFLIGCSSTNFTKDNQEKAQPTDPRYMAQRRPSSVDKLPKCFDKAPVGLKGNDLLTAHPSVVELYVVRDGKTKGTAKKGGVVTTYLGIGVSVEEAHQNACYIAGLNDRDCLDTDSDAVYFDGRMIDSFASKYRRAVSKKLGCNLDEN